MVDNPDIWDASKLEIFRDEFMDFLNCCEIHSKETGGHTILGENIFGSQTRLLDGVFSGLAEGIHDFKVLKSRQLGCSTFARAFALFWMGVHDGLSGACILDSDGNKEAARREIETMIENLPARLKFPKIKTQNRYGITLANGSKLLFMSAGQRKGRGGGTLGRSAGLNFTISSEMCSWENQEGVVSLRASLSKMFPNRLYIWESTARGFNVWYDMWEEAKNDDLTQRAIFLGWWSRDDQRVKTGTPAFEKYGKEPPTDKELERIKAVKDQYGVDIDQEQLAWFRQTTDPNQTLEAGEQEDPTQRQEQPWTEEEAFVLTGSSFFSGDKLSEMIVKTSSPNWTGYKYYPGLDFFNTRIERAKSVRDVQLKVWEEPVHDATYIVTADPAFGHDETNNNSALHVLRCYADRVEQVAEFASPLMPTNHFAWVIASLCGWYGCGPDGNFNNTVNVIIELNGPGEAVWNEFRALKTIVENPYYRKEARERGIANVFNNVRNYIYSRSDAMHGGNNWMWKTSQQLKEVIFERFRDFLNSEIVVIRSQALLEEMKGVVRDGSTIGAEGRNRDDRAFAMAMGLRCWEERVRRQMMAAGKTKQRDEETRKVSAVDRFALFNRGQLDAFFKKKTMARIQSAAAARYQGWRYR